jgi:hypothetical protein
MSKGLAIFLSFIAFIVAYVPAVVFYVRPQLTFGLATAFNIPLYMALGVSVFLVFSLIAFIVRAYSVAVVIAFIPVIVYITIGIIAGIAFLFYKDIMIALVQDKISTMFAGPLEGAQKIAEGIAQAPLNLFGK